MILETLNQTLFLSLNAGPSTAGWKIGVASVLADDAIFLIPAILVSVWCWSDAPNRRLALKACVVALLALGVNQLLGMGWPHPRPFAIGLGHTFISHADDSSFPSDHATVFAAIGVTFLAARATRILGLLIILLGAGVAWARVFLGVHFPLHMAGAVAVVLVVLGLISPLWSRVSGYLTGYAERIYRSLLSWPIAAGWIRK